MSCSRRDFLRLALVGSGATALSPLFIACGSVQKPGPTPAKLEPEILGGLAGLDVDAFFQQAYRRWMVRDPETLTALGLADRYGVGDGNLTDVSDSFLRDTQALEAALLVSLRAYDRSVFTPTQALTAEIFEWFLDDLVRGHAFLYDDYLINPIITSVHYNLYALFAIYQPLGNLEDAHDYIRRLSQVRAKIPQWIDGLERRAQKGVVLPAFMAPIVLGDIRPIAATDSSSHPFHTFFSQRLSGVTDVERTALLEQVDGEISQAVVPSYQQLADFLTSQQSKARNTVGVWQFADGAAYYAQCLRRQTTTEATADEVHDLGRQHVARIHAEMRTLFAKLGFPTEDGMPQLVQRLERESGSLSGQEAVTAYQNAIRQAETLLPQAFEALPRTKVTVVGGNEGDYYMPAPFDGSRPGIFYARTTGGTAKFGVKSLAYHETVPGHHLQAALAQEVPDLPDLRRNMQFNAFVEGWALYAERLMWELGAYSNDAPGDLGRLQLEVFRAARLVVDTGIHAMRWSFNEAVDYLVQATGYSVDYAQREVTRYSVWPGQAISYYLGFLKLLELRQKAKGALGGRFDLKAFHRVVLENGAMPLSILGEVVDRHIDGGE